MKLFRKLKGRRGFSLAELLVAMLILTMVSMVACMGISTATADRIKAITMADAQSVASTAAQAVSDQVRYGQISNVGSDYIELTSSTYGNKVKLCLEGGRLVAQSTSGVNNALLGENAYSGLAVDSLEFEADTSAGKVEAVKITLSVGGSWSLTWTVAPLNPYIAT